MFDIMSVVELILARYGTDQGDSGGPRRISKRELLTALRHAGLPRFIDLHRAYFVGVDSRGRRFAIILAADDVDEDLWHTIHALQTRYRRNI